MRTFDAIIIGSGQGGTPLSKKLAKAGWNTALIEKGFIGGTCINVGCTPTKAMIASARMAYLAANSQKLGIDIPESSVNLSAIVDRKNAIVKQFRNGAKDGLEKTENLTLFFGEAAFTGCKEIEISLSDGAKEAVTAKYIFIDTGTTTTIPPIEGMDSVPYLTSSTILDLTEIPSHLLIVGASYIACEFGQMFKRFGSNITILEHASNFLSREDKDVSDCLLNILRADGLDIYTNASLKKLVSSGNSISATITKDGREKEINCSHLLIAVGRTPQTKHLQLEKTGVAVDEDGYIKVNVKLETSQPEVYAIGDVKGGPAFTHISYNDHLVILKNLVEKADVSIEGRPVPYCMFTDPQLGRIGITEHEAKKKGLNIKVATLSMKNVARAIETGETKGIMKAVVDADTKQILGAAIIGEQGGEIKSVLEMAMAGKMTYHAIREMIFAHPLYAESLNNLFMKLETGNK